MAPSVPSRPSESPRLVLSIAGSDSCGGAGLQADQRTFHAFGLRAATAITAMTAQNPAQVRAIVEVAPEFVVLQARTVTDHESVAAIKTGMLASAPTIDAVAAYLEALGPARPPLVVDPVMVATSGAALLAPGAVEILRRRLLPLAEIVTPNLYEAAILVGEQASRAAAWSEEEQAEAAREILAMGARAALVKGGHRQGTAADVLATARGLTWLDASRVDAASTHGTGCTLAAGIAAGLALDLDLIEAVRRAKEHLTRALAMGIDRPLVADFSGPALVRISGERS